MKKLSERHRRHLIRKSRQETRSSFSKRIRAERMAIQSQVIRTKRGALPKARISSINKHITFDAPEVFNIYENYEETLAFLLDVRSFFSRRINRGGGRGRIRPYHANFSTIKEIDPASGLLLAAEVDRWSRITKRKPVSYDFLWPRFLRNYFADAGLFNLLDIPPQTEPDGETGDSDLKAISYRSDVLTQGAIADAFRGELEALAGEAIGPRQDVYVALSEAMANVVGHAYPSEEGSWHPAVRRRWWMGGSWSQSDHVVTVQIYDQGVGIPATLPRSPHWSNMLPILKALDPERSDASLIEGAMQYRRTSTGKKGRGKGMAQMAEWIDRTSQGSLRILSGRGSLTYLPGRPPIRRTLPVDFGGTLVEWKVPL